MRPKTKTHDVSNIKCLSFSLIIAAVLLPFACFAGWAPKSNALKSYVHSGFGVHALVNIENTDHNPAGCNTAWYAVSKQDNPAFDDIHSVLLTAVAAGKPIQVNVDPNACSPHGYALITHVILHSQ